MRFGSYAIEDTPFPNWGAATSVFDNLSSQLSSLHQQGALARLNPAGVAAGTEKPITGPDGKQYIFKNGKIQPYTPQSATGGRGTGMGPTLGNAAASMAVPQEYRPLIEQEANRYGIDPNLVAAVIWQESKFNPRAVSPAGAQGLGQLMPATARGLGVTDPFDAAQNIAATARFLAYNLERYQGNLEKAVAAYNAGPGAVDQYGGIPPYAETQRYVPSVLGQYNVYKSRGLDGPTAANPGVGVSQYDLGLPKEIADAFCSPAAVIQFMTYQGRTPNVMEVMNMAKEEGWTVGAGQAGPQAHINLLRRLGIPAYMGPIDPQKIANEAMAGRPVVIDTPGHYYQITGYNQATGTFTFGDAVGARAGNTGTSLDGISRFGFGAPRTAIYLGTQ